MILVSNLKGVKGVKFSKGINFILKSIFSETHVGEAQLNIFKNET